MEAVMQTIRIYNQIIGMGIGIGKRAMLKMKRGKGETAEGIELSKPRKNKKSWRKGRL